MEINIPKGTHDVIKEEARAYDHIENVLQSLASYYGFSPMRTPIFEQTELFTRSVGDSSDIVRKEMYTFVDKGNRSMTLRPEITAGVMRSIVSNKLYATEDLPIKAYYLGPTFRYERPQQGRFRQFNQFGVESVGVTSPYSDAETVLLGVFALKMLGFENITLKMNTLGDEESRVQYKAALKTFFAGHLSHMCADCHARYETNPLRMLDCKVPEDQELVASAPKMRDFLSEKAKKDFLVIQDILDSFDIGYTIDDNLVRGLDYYSNLVFEFHYTSKLGKDYGAIGAGGHYDRLLEEVGGPSLSGVGFAFGIERIYAIMRDDGLLEDLKETTDFYIMPMGEAARIDAFSLAHALRNSGLTTDICYEDKSFKQLFKKAEKKQAKFAIIIGEDEVKNEKVTVKNLTTEEQFKVSYQEIVHTAFHLIDRTEHHHGDSCQCDHEHEDECQCEHEEGHTCHCDHKHE